MCSFLSVWGIFINCSGKLCVWEFFEVEVLRGDLFLLGSKFHQTAAALNWASSPAVHVTQAGQFYHCLIQLRQGLSLNVELARLEAAKPQWSSCLQLPNNSYKYAWNHTLPLFEIRNRDLNSDSHAWTGSSPTRWTVSPGLFLWFYSMWHNICASLRGTLLQCDACIQHVIIKTKR